MKKLTAEHALAIRQKYRPGIKGHGLTALAKQYGTYKRNIKCIVDGFTWKNVGGPRYSPRVPDDPCMRIRAVLERIAG